MVRKIFTGLLLMGLAGLAQAAPVYIEFPSIPGESSAEGHKGWIEINSQQFSPALAPTAQRGGKGTLKFNKRQDKTSPKIMEASAMGKRIPIVTLETGTPGQADYLKVEMKDVLVSSFQAGGTETVELSFNVYQRVSLPVPTAGHVKPFDGKTGAEVISK